MKTALLLAAFAAGCVCASASTVVWTLHDVAFSDGATATGWVSVTPSNHLNLSYSISVSGGTDTRFPDFTYASGAPDNVRGTTVPTGDGHTLMTFWTDLFLTPDAAPTAYRAIRFMFDGALPAGGTINIIPATFSGECYNCGTYRALTSGYMTGDVVEDTPEPATWMVALPALAWLGFRRRW